MPSSGSKIRAKKFIMPHKKKLADRIVQKIEVEAIKPTPKFVFTSQNFILWSLFTLAAFVGALSVSIILYIALEVDFEIYDYFPSREERFYFLLSAMPIVWIMSVFVFFHVSNWALKNTKTGYRWPVWQILCVNIVISCIFGSLLYAIGFAETVEEKTGDRAPFYKSVREHQRAYWAYPEKNGRLAGRIESVLTDSWLQLKDPNGKTWRVFYGESKRAQDFQPISGELIKMRGNIIDGQTFKAQRMGKHQRPSPLIRPRRDDDRTMISPRFSPRPDRFSRPESLRTIVPNNLPPEIKSRLREDTLRNDPVINIER